MKKIIALILIAMIALPELVSAEIDTDLRIKYGTAAGAQRLELVNFVGHGSGDKGSNASIELALSLRRESKVRFMISLGAFHRQHTGDMNDLSYPTNVNYEVDGLSLAPGVRVKINERWYAEGKVEIGRGNEGRVTFNSPGVAWNATKTGTYGSLSVIGGIYYLFKNISSRVGVELGVQTFQGDFGIWSNYGYWDTCSVTGTSPIANIAYSYQF
ncbi:MAG TPA: hypothetical protein VK654_01620 [Nitrospirota bacterium]|nr:hypothetical protein [Nitrospirota bacterium]